MSVSRDNEPSEGKAASAGGWTSLTWDELHRWAGGRSVSRGRAYQREGRVKELAAGKDGRLLATVAGGECYTTAVWLVAGKTGEEALGSQCTCPVGYRGCKHAVAVVAEYLDRLANDKAVAVAREDDPRWARLAGDVSESGVEDEEESEEELGESGAGLSAAQRGARAGWDKKIRQHIEAKSREELVELVWSLTARFSELREEFRERISLSEGDVDRLLKEARKELQEVTSRPGWRERWSEEGYIPDYSKLKHRLERLVEKGHCDAVVPLGREIIERGLEQVEQSHDEGETASAVGECLPLVFKAVAESKLPGSQKVLFVIDAYLKDSYDIIGEAAEVVMEADYRPEDWSAVADELRRRLERMPGRQGDFERSYHRDGISGWLADALEKAGRESEVRALYEKEAGTTGSYERLVRFLIEGKCYDDAERWATEGIDKTRQQYPGIARNLAGALRDVARVRGQWDVVAAHAACLLFDRPGVTEFKDLIAAAGQAGQQKRVRKVALQFLETGVGPIRVTTSRQGNHKAIVAAEWPLLVPGFLLPLMAGEGRSRSHEGPHYDVLIHLAIEEKRPADAIRWYDAMRVGRKASGGPSWYGGGDYGDDVAKAVAESHPERALAIYAERVDAYLKQASPAAYETVAGYLRKMRPILQSLKREEEWGQLVAEIRVQYRNRPRFMEILERLEGGTIVQTQRRGR